MLLNEIYQLFQDLLLENKTLFFFQYSIFLIYTKLTLKHLTSKDSNTVSQCIFSIMFRLKCLLAMTNSNPDAINVLWLLFDVIIFSLRPCLIIATNTKNNKKNKTNNNNSNDKCRQPDGPKISGVLWWIVQIAYHLAIECIAVTSGEKWLYTEIFNV